MKWHEKRKIGGERKKIKSGEKREMAAASQSAAESIINQRHGGSMARMNLAHGINSMRAVRATHHCA